MSDPFHVFRGKSIAEIKGVLMMLTAGKDASTHPRIVLFRKEYDNPTFDPGGDIALWGWPSYSDNRYAGHRWNHDECAARIHAAMSEAKTIMETT